MSIPFPEWSFSPQPSPIMPKKSTWGRVKQAQMVLQEFRTSFGKYHRIDKAIKAMQDQDRIRRLVFGDFPIQKVAKVDGRLFLDLSTPGFPSEAYQKYCQYRYDRIDPIDEQLCLFLYILYKPKVKVEKG